MHTDPHCAAQVASEVYLPGVDSRDTLGDVDLLLSSGFLAFARHLGFLDALTAEGVDIEGLVGTSSGAMVGALWSAGHPLDDIAEELSRTAPLWTLRPSWRPWRGAFSLETARARLSTFLPETFEALSRPFAVGVVGPDGAYRLVTEGDLPAAVIASCAMPYVFNPVRVNDEICHDGGAKDRLGVDAWRIWRPDRTALAHWVMRTAGQDVDTDLSGVTVVRTPRSGAKLWSLGDFAGQRKEACKLTLDQWRARGGLGKNADVRSI